MSSAVESYLDKYNSRLGLPGLEFETGLLFEKNIKLNHGKLFTLLSSSSTSVEVLEHLDVYYPDNKRKTIYFSKGVNQKKDTALTKISLEQPFFVKRHIDEVKSIKTKISQEVPIELPKGNPDFMRFKLRIKFTFPGKKWTAELDLIKEVKSSGVDLKSIKDIIFKPYSIDNMLNSIEYSMFNELRLEFEYSDNISMDEFFEPLNLISVNVNGDDNYQRQIFQLARNIVFNRKAYLETFRSRSGLKKLLNNVIEVNSDTFYKKIQPSLSSQGFYVTDKIDGLRTILCVGKRSFLINNKLTDISGKSNETTYIDCEMVGDILYAFDVITFNGTVMSTKPFAERLEVLQSAVDYVSTVISMQIQTKKFVLLNENWKSQLREFYDQKRSYEIDGMIFTPNDSSDYQSMIGYKWKPAEHSTIDFYIKKVPSGYVLMSGASKQDIEQFSLKTLNKSKDNKPLTPVLFTPSNSPHVYKWQSSEDLDNKIGEFGWSKLDQSWKLHRIRTDRDVELARGEYYGNYFKVAESIWYSIHNPLTFEMLFEESSGYFAEDNSERYKAQRNFNSYVKTEVLSKCVDSLKDNNNLGLVIDLAAGKGQDMARLFNLGVSDAIFVDNDSNALQELIRRKHTLSKWINKKQTKITTAQLDLKTDHKILAKAITNAYGDKVSASLIICNFAIHYFTESSEVFNNFISLVKSLLSENGLFVFTCFDGQKVFDLCEPHGWEHLENSEIKYSIKPAYDSNVLEPFGQKVKLVLPFSKGEYYEEYLVNLNMVAKILEDNEFFKEAIGSFSNFSGKLTEDEKIFTGLYSYCVFRKSKNLQSQSISLPNDDIVIGASEDDREQLLNLPQANFIKIKTDLKGAALTHVINCFEENGYRNYDQNKRLKKKIFTFGDYSTDTEVIILKADIENYMQWVTKFCINRVELKDLAIMNHNDSTILRIN